MQNNSSDRFNGSRKGETGFRNINDFGNSCLEKEIPLIPAQKNQHRHKMKIIIISDIRSNAESIIPFGFKLARDLKSVVDIIHTIDSRTEHVLPSSYSDSQTFALDGNKFSYADTLEREKKTAKLLLDKMISHAASNLRYPLKVNIIIEETSIEHKIREYLNKKCTDLFLFSSQPDGHIFNTVEEIFDAVNDTGVNSLIIPPGQKYNSFAHVSVPADFTSEDFKKYRHLAFLFRNFRPHISAIGISKTKDHADKDVNAAKWKTAASAYFRINTVETILLAGNDYRDTLVNYLSKYNTDLLLLFYKKQNILKSLFGESISMKIIEQIRMPVLLSQGN